MESENSEEPEALRRILCALRVLLVTFVPHPNGRNLLKELEVPVYRKEIPTAGRVTKFFKE